AATISRYQTADGFFARTLPLAERPLRQAYDNQLELVATINGERRSYVVWRDCTVPAPTLKLAQLPAQRTNLIANPSFETSIDGWEYGTTASQDPPVPLSRVLASATNLVEAGSYAL